jgi:tetratricopeptide (TPR) repeat protein
MSARLVDDPAYSLLMLGAALLKCGGAAEAFRQSSTPPGLCRSLGIPGEARQHIHPIQPSRSASQASTDGLRGLQTAVELDPASTAAHTLLAMCYRQGNNEQALRAVVTAVSSLRKSGPRAQCASCWLLRDLISFESYQQPQRVRPVHASDHRFCLDYNFHVEQIALPLARRLLAAGRRRSQFGPLGQVLVHLGDLASAERFLVNALQADPTFAAAHLHLGLVYLLQGSPQAARRSLETQRHWAERRQRMRRRRLLEGGSP